jgi:hypothetical protein
MVKNRNSSFGGTSHINSSLDSEEFEDEHIKGRRSSTIQ